MVVSCLTLMCLIAARISDHACVLEGTHYACIARLNALRLNALRLLKAQQLCFAPLGAARSLHLGQQVVFVVLNLVVDWVVW